MFDKALELLKKYFGFQGHDSSQAAAWDFVGMHGNVRQGLLYATLFVPEFVEADGSVFIESKLIGTADEMKDPVAKAEKEGTRAVLEDAANTVDLCTLFADHAGTEEEVDLMMEFMAEAWRARLAYQFPGRRFHVWIESWEEAGTPVLRFYELR